MKRRFPNAEFMIRIFTLIRQIRALRWEVQHFSGLKNASLLFPVKKTAPSPMTENVTALTEAAKLYACEHLFP
jgi:hypothetical protein